MKSKLIGIFVLMLLCFISYKIGSYINEKSELRQLAKEKLKLEIELLKIQIEQQEINLQKEY